MTDSASAEYPFSKWGDEVFLEIADLLAESDGDERPHLEILCEWLSDGSPLNLIVPLFMVGRTQTTLDIATEYLAALHVGEQLAPLAAESSAVQRVPEHDVFNLEVDFRFVVRDARPFVEELYRVAQAWNPEIAECDDVQQEQADLGYHLECIQDGSAPNHLLFPELADDYIANVIGGVGDDHEDEEARLLAKFPEFSLPMWRSFASSKEIPVFLGRHFWLLDARCDVQSFLKKYFRFYADDFTLHLSKRLDVLRRPLYAVDEIAVWAPTELLGRAEEFAERLFPAPEAERKQGRVFLTEGGAAIVVEGSRSTFVAFRPEVERIQSPELSELLGQTSDAAEVLRGALGLPANITLPWDSLDDEAFEQLCYDVVAREFSVTRLQKMGKSRSRDGGRDLEFYIPGSGTRWIGQAKLVGGGRSLGASRLNGVSEMLDARRPDGYVLLTNALIDSTAQDLLHAIEKHRSITVELRSGMELERFLARNPDIRRRYFKPLG